MEFPNLNLITIIVRVTLHSLEIISYCESIQGRCERGDHKKVKNKQGKK